MNGTDHTELTTAGDGAGLDPRGAATLIEATTRQARREFDPQRPLTALGAAAVFLFGYGAVWLSIRGQHPYKGPAGWAVGLLYALVIVAVIANTRMLKRASAGVSGRARRQMQLQGLAYAAAYAGAYVFMGALRYLGVSFAIIYGVYAPTAPLIVVGSALATDAVGRENWPQLGVAIAIIAVCAGSAYAGPRGAWGFAGAGCCLALIGYAAALVVWQRRA